MQCSIEFHEDETGQGTCGRTSPPPIGPDGKKKHDGVKKETDDDEVERGQEKKRHVPPPPSLSRPIRAEPHPSMPEFEMPGI